MVYDWFFGPSLTSDPLVNTHATATHRSAYTYGGGAGIPLNVIGHQGLPHDEETGLLYQRNRIWNVHLGRFNQVDPSGYPDGLNRFAGYHVLWGTIDPLGLAAKYRPFLVVNQGLAKGDNQTLNRSHSGGLLTWSVAVNWNLSDSGLSLTSSAVTYPSGLIGEYVWNYENRSAIASIDFSVICICDSDGKVTAEMYPSQNLKDSKLDPDLLPPFPWPHGAALPDNRREDIIRAGAYAQADGISVGKGVLVDIIANASIFSNFSFGPAVTGPFSIPKTALNHIKGNNRGGVADPKKAAAILTAQALLNMSVADGELFGLPVDISEYTRDPEGSIGINAVLVWECQKVSD